MYDYWVRKRKNCRGPSLIPQIKQEKRDGSTNNDPYVAFRRRTEKMQTRKVMCKLDLIECALIVLKTNFFSANNFNNFEYLEHTGELITLLNLTLEILLFSSFHRSASVGIISMPFIGLFIPFQTWNWSRKRNYISLCTSEIWVLR